MIPARDSLARCQIPENDHVMSTDPRDQDVRNRLSLAARLVRLSRDDRRDDHGSQLAGFSQLPRDLVARHDLRAHREPQPVQRLSRLFSRHAHLRDVVRLRLAVLGFLSVRADRRPTPHQFRSDSASRWTPVPELRAQRENASGEFEGTAANDGVGHAGDVIQSVRQIGIRRHSKKTVATVLRRRRHCNPLVSEIGGFCDR